MGTKAAVKVGRSVLPEVTSQTSRFRRCMRMVAFHPGSVELLDRRFVERGGGCRLDMVGAPTADNSLLSSASTKLL